MKKIFNIIVIAILCYLPACSKALEELALISFSTSPNGKYDVVKREAPDESEGLYIVEKIDQKVKFILLEGVSKIQPNVYWRSDSKYVSVFSFYGTRMMSLQIVHIFDNKAKDIKIGDAKSGSFNFDEWISDPMDASLEVVGWDSAGTQFKITKESEGKKSIVNITLIESEGEVSAKIEYYDFPHK